MNGLGRFYIIFAIGVWGIGCSNMEGSLQEAIELELEEKEGLGFKVVGFEGKTVMMEVELDFERVGVGVYLDQVSRLEEILKGRGFEGISYELIKTKNGGLSFGEEWGKEGGEESGAKKEEEGGRKGLELLRRKRGRINYDFVRLRGGVGRQSDIRTYLFKGTVVEVLRESVGKEKIGMAWDYWYEVKTADDKKGWVYGKYISETEEEKISSSLQNNAIYMKLIREKKELMGGMEGMNKGIKIGERDIVIRSKEGEESNISFHLRGNKVEWLDLGLEEVGSEKREENREENRKRIVEKEVMEKDRRAIKKRKKKRKKLTEDELLDDFLFGGVGNIQREFVGLRFGRFGREEGNRQYTLEMKASPYLRNYLSQSEYRMLEGVIKLAYHRLIAKDYDWKKVGVIFEEEVDVNREILDIEVLGVDFERKKGRVMVRKLRFENGEAIEVMRVEEEVSFKEGFNKGGVEFGVLDEGRLGRGYEEVMKTLPIFKSELRREVVGFGNNLVDYMLSKKYL